MAWMALAVGVILCAVSVLLGFKSRTFMGRPLGGDFVEFYTIGQILNHYSPARIYDLRLATALQHAALPSMPETQMLVFGQAPFIAPLFRPFALLPYAWAYVLWLAFSAALFSASLALLFHTLRWNAQDRRTGFLLALSSTPFLFETWIGGQMSVVVFSIWVLFFWCIENHRTFLSGFVLAACLFKPTLIVLPALMLLIGRRWRILGGLAAGGVAMALLSIATVGVNGCMAWVSALAMNGHTAARAGEAWHQAKYVDILAFSHLLFVNLPAVADAAAIAVALLAVAWLGWAWWKSDALTIDRRLWAATLCLALVISPYAPIYDTILAIAAVALVFSDAQPLAGWILALYLIPWVTQSFAEFLHLQLLTVTLAAFAVSSVYQFRPAREESTITGILHFASTGRFQVRSRGLP